MQRKHELTKILQSIDIFVCVETWLSGNITNQKIFQVAGYKLFRKDRQGTSGGGILFLTKSLLDVEEIHYTNNSIDNFEILGIKIKNIEPVLDIYAYHKIGRAHV